MSNLPIRRQMLLCAVLFSLTTLAIMAVGLAGLRAERGVIEDLTAVTGSAISLNSSILATMTTAEAGLRDYQASGDPALLRSSSTAERNVRTDEGRLRALLASPRFDGASQGIYLRQQAAQDTAITRWWRDEAGVRTGKTPATTADAVFGQFLAANSALIGSLNAHRAAEHTRADRTLSISVFALVGVAILMMLSMFLAAPWVARTVANPVVRLRETVNLQRRGIASVSADEEHGPAEIRSLAVAFNAMTTETAGLVAEQAEALRLQEAVFNAGQLIRGAASPQRAMHIVCIKLGEALRARRVMVVTFDAAPKIDADIQWHAPDLDDLPGVPADLVSMIWQSAENLWNSNGQLVVNDVLTGEIAQREWARRFHRDAGARAFIMVPVGLGDRVIGALYVVDDTGPRQWAQAEVVTVQQLATYLARAITQAESEEHRAQYLTQLENLDRQKTEFLSTVSHELRTPLTSIQGYLELLSDGEAGPVTVDQQQMLAIIDRNAVRLRGLIEDILALNRIESSGLARGTDAVSLTSLVTSSAEDLRPAADKAGVHLETHTGADPANVSGDRAQLQRALVNVLSNAIKFTRRDGVVRLSCTTDPDAGEAVITCQDTGIGIPKEDLEHLFTRFFRASNATRQAIPGTGLGLAIVQAIVDVHLGSLTLESAEGQGTTITMRFPLTSRQEDAPASQ